MGDLELIINSRFTQIKEKLREKKEIKKISIINQSKKKQ